MNTIIKHNLDWQQQLKTAITDSQKLLTVLELTDPTIIAAAQASAKLFPLKVPLAFVEKIQKGNIDDPLLKQILPILAEQQQNPNFSQDPLQERNFSPVAGVLHKYHGRVLVLLTGACAVNCRYCFRRHFPYSDHSLNDAARENIIKYIRENSSISEVILSGGDPLLLKDRILENFLQQLSTINHLKTLRIHSRFPVMIPERINDELIAVLNQSRLKKIMVLHINHPNEIDLRLKIAITRLQQGNIVVLNQSVLLKSINDDAKVLIDLSQKLFDAGVLPYYLHLMDQVQNAAHFEVNEVRAKSIHQEITQRLPGYLVPKLVKEVPGKLSKVKV